MTRDENGLQMALKKARAQRLLVDTASGVILGYTDVYGKQRGVRPQVYEAIAGSRVAVLTICEYLRMTRDDDKRRKEQEGHVTAGEWYRSLDGRFEGFMESIRENTNIKKKYSNMKEETKMKKTFSPEAKAEAVARFSEALNREDIDGLVFGVSTVDGNLCTGFTAYKGTLTYIMAKIFVDAGLDLGIFMRSVALHMIFASRKEDDND